MSLLKYQGYFLQLRDKRENGIHGLTEERKAKEEKREKEEGLQRRKPKLGEKQ